MEAGGAVTKISFVFCKLVLINTPVLAIVDERMAAIFKELSIYNNKDGIFAQESVWVEVSELNAPF
jgi:hypothetical protein